MTYEWYRNGELVPDERDANVSAGAFARGDRVYADRVRVRQAAPGLAGDRRDHHPERAAAGATRSTLTPVRPTGLDLIEAQATGRDADSDEFAYEYRWFERTARARRHRLAARARHGQARRPAVRAGRGQRRQRARSTDRVRPASRSRTPRRRSPRQPNYDARRVGSLQLRRRREGSGRRSAAHATSWSKAPPGMTVDVATGVSPGGAGDAKGTYPIELAVSDPLRRQDAAELRARASTGTRRRPTPARAARARPPPAAKPRSPRRARRRPGRRRSPRRSSRPTRTTPNRIRNKNRARRRTRRVLKPRGACGRVKSSLGSRSLKSLFGTADSSPVSSDRDPVVIQRTSGLDANGTRFFCRSRKRRVCGREQRSANSRGAHDEQGRAGA